MDQDVGDSMNSVYCGPSAHQLPLNSSCLTNFLLRANLEILLECHMKPQLAVELFFQEKACHKAGGEYSRNTPLENGVGGAGSAADESGYSPSVCFGSMTTKQALRWHSPGYLRLPPSQIFERASRAAADEGFRCRCHRVAVMMLVHF
jgi:hypothetical protein